MKPLLKVVTEYAESWVDPSILIHTIALEIQCGNHPALTACKGLVMVILMIINMPALLTIAHAISPRVKRHAYKQVCRILFTARPPLHII